MVLLKGYILPKVRSIIYIENNKIDNPPLCHDRRMETQSCGRLCFYTVCIVCCQSHSAYRSQNSYFPFRSNVQAAKNLNLPYIDDINSPTQPPFGCGRLHFTIDEQSQRHSAYRAFLPVELVLKRSNLHICTSTLADSISTIPLDGGSCKVDGVSLVRRSGQDQGTRRRIRVRKELILTAGPFGDPEILMRR